MHPVFEKRFIAEASDIDVMGHVNNAVWVRWMEEIATAHWQAVADPAHIAAFAWVVTRHEIDYRGNLALGEGATARSWIEQPPGSGGSGGAVSGGWRPETFRAKLISYTLCTVERNRTANDML
jgi:hypothetical protein